MNRDRWHTIIGAAALGSLGYGCWLITPAVAMIVIGATLLAGIIYARSG